MQGLLVGDADTGLKTPSWCTACVTTNASMGHLPVVNQLLAPVRPCWDALISSLSCVSRMLGCEAFALFLPLYFSGLPMLRRWGNQKAQRTIWGWNGQSMSSVAFFRGKNIWEVFFSVFYPLRKKYSIANGGRNMAFPSYMFFVFM